MSSFLDAAQAVKEEEEGAGGGFWNTGVGHPPLAGRRPQLADFPGKVGKGACTYSDLPLGEGNTHEQNPTNSSISGANCQHI